MKAPAKIAFQVLRWLFPFRWIFVAIVALTGTGLALHEMERFEGLAWGLTELSHVWIGWAGLLLWTGYLIHHVVVRWGAWTSVQRWLGFLLAVVSVLLLVTGTLLGIGMSGGPPAWALPVHWYATWVLVGLLVAHTFVVWKRWPRRLWRRLLYGPRAVRGAPEEAAEPSA